MYVDLFPGYLGSSDFNQHEKEEKLCDFKCFVSASLTGSSLLTLLQLSLLAVQVLYWSTFCPRLLHKISILKKCLNQLFPLRCKMNCDVLSLSWTKILHFREYPLNLCTGTLGAITTNTLWCVTEQERVTRTFIRWQISTLK